MIMFQHVKWNLDICIKQVGFQAISEDPRKQK